ncbi:MAG: TIGR00730 family Rossman fold protein [Propionibacteriales bacterium]|nr:TIGR00730 family Rossman fold protein [Propionibacteriales bacterium]
MRLAVFTGSSMGRHEEYAHTARALGRHLAERGVGIVYGGAHVGLMGALADAALAAGGDVTGVMPRNLVDAEIAHTGLTRLDVVDSMHERKARMAALADGFVALPGGIGTLEELFEVWTWQRIGLHTKPVALLDVAGYWTGLLTFLDTQVAEGFVRPADREALLLVDELDRLLPALDAWRPTPSKLTDPEVVGPANTRRS